MTRPWIALRRRLEEAGLLHTTYGPFDDITLVIDHLANDSRKVGPNGLFVAIRGEHADGHLFAPFRPTVSRFGSKGAGRW